jgi:cobalt/nickel transport system permease protein
MTGWRTRRPRGFVERTLEGLRDAMERTVEAERASEAGGLLQRLDPRVKLVGMVALIVAVALASRLAPIAAVLVLTVIAAISSGVPLRVLASRVWLGALAFTGAIAIPALFLTPGRPVAAVPLAGWTVTAQGLVSASYLVLRVLTAATLAFLLVWTTPWMHVLKALRILHVPVVFVVALGMAYRYILLTLETAHEMFESRQSRTIGPMPPAERRRLATASIGVLLGRTVQLSGDVYLAMLARGFRGDVHVIDEFRMSRADWAGLVSFAVVTAAAIWAGW